jgi:septal ring factor EnvC (AmiA/AmiB activator)
MMGMKISEFGTVAGLVSAISVCGTIAAYKPEPSPTPKCEINEKALDAIKEQNKALFDSNSDLRNAIENMPKDTQEIIKERTKTAEKQRELENKIQAAEEAKKAYDKLKDKPCEKVSVIQESLTTQLTTANVVYATKGIGYAPINTDLGGFSINLGHDKPKPIKNPVVPIPSALALFAPAAVVVLWKFRA